MCLLRGGCEGMVVREWLPFWDGKYRMGIV